MNTYQGITIKTYPYNHKAEAEAKTFNTYIQPKEKVPKNGDLNNYEYNMSRYENRAKMY